MDIKFTVAARISKPIAEVFEAVVNPEQLSHYFTTGGAQGRLETGATVTWDFHDFPGAFPVQVVEVQQNSRIVLSWDAAESETPGDGAPAGYKTTVTMTFEELAEDRTLVTITEGGWPETALKSAFGNCEGWTGMLCAMKVWLEHGIKLRAGMYK